MQLLQAYVGVRGDGENQVIHRRFAGEVVRVGLVTHHGIFLETHEHKRAGADWLAVELLGCAGLEQFIGIFSRIDRGKAHAQCWEEGGIGMVEGEAHGQWVKGVDFLHQCRQLQGLGVRKAALGDLVPRVGRVEHALEAEAYIFGRQGAAWAEIAGAMEFHIGVQFEGVRQPIGRHFPAICKARYQLATGRVEFHQTVHQHVGRGVGGGQ